MARRKRMTETIVGLFVLASLFLLLVLVIFIGRRQNIFQQRYELHGFFNSVGGLQTGADVQLAGISVGYVRSVSFGPDSRVNVVLSVNANQMQRIRADSVASIKTMGLMGDRYVAITVGSSTEPIIPPDGTIKTQEIMELSDVLDSARPTLENLQNTMQNISDLTDQLASPESDVTATLKNVRVLTTDIREGKGTIGALMQRDDLYEKANGVLDTTRQTMENLKTASSNLQKASTDLPSVMENVRTSVEQMDAFATRAAVTATEIYQLVDDGQKVMDDAKAMASNLNSASEEIKRVTPRIGPLIESADEGVTEAKDVIEAAKGSWLLRGSFEPPAGGGPIVVGERDVARPEGSE